MENQEFQNYNEPLERDLKNLQITEISLSPDNPPWNSGIAFLSWFVSVALIVIIPAIVFVIYIFSKGISLTDQAQLGEIIKNDINASILQIVAIFPAHILTLVMAWAIVTRFNKYSFREMLGWKFNNFRFWHIIAVIVPIFILALALTSYFGEQENEMTRLLKSSRTAVILVAILATFTAPIVEEVIYRGILYSAFQRTFGTWAAVFLVTLLFAIIHVPQYFPNFVTISVICVLSLALTLVRVWTKNLLPCIVLHFVINGIQSVGLIVEPYISKPQ